MGLADCGKASVERHLSEVENFEGGRVVWGDGAVRLVRAKSPFHFSGCTSSVRGKVTSLSSRSLNRFREKLFCGAKGFQLFLTLTYHCEMQDGAKAKRDLNAFLQMVRRRRRVWGVSHYVWVAEFQRRGSLHFHVWLRFKGGDETKWNGVGWILSRHWLRSSNQDTDSDARLVHLGGWLSNGRMREETAWELVRKPHAVGAYALKYARKKEQKELPEGLEGIGRWWGTCRVYPLAVWCVVSGMDALMEVEKAIVAECGSSYSWRYWFDGRGSPYEGLLQKQREAV